LSAGLFRKREKKMNADQIINKSLDQINIHEDSVETFTNLKNAIAKAINIIDQALPKMKASGIDMSKIGFDTEQLFKSVVRKSLGSNAVDLYIIKDGNKAILTISINVGLTDIIDVVVNEATNY
jgi:hypothetical protein